MIHIRTSDGEYIRIENEVWITANRNGIVITPHRVKAKGVGDGTSIWSLGELEGFPEARIITRAEYEERMGSQDDDPELSAEEALAVMMGGSYEAE
ncbi:MAG: hypothetical protein IKD27_09215 [Oscillospiraceae bacterium]|nr:hypothetical protein [Oscillospiraceae bacterium]